MLFHIETRRPTRWPSNASILKVSLQSLMVVLIFVSGIEAIVKQQRSDDSPQSQQQQQQHSSSAYQNHKSSANSAASQPSVPSSSSSANSVSPSLPSQSSSSQSSSPSASSSINSIPSVPNSLSLGAQQHSNIQPSYSSSVSMSSSASPSSSGSQQSVGGPQASQMSNSGSRLDQLNSAYGSYSPMQKSSSQYGNLDNMAVAASNQDQSYQAAANSVNMALANSGIFGPSSASAYGSMPSASSSQSSSGSQSSAPSSGVQSGQNSPQSLNPLHYFYYPAKQDSSSGASSASSASSGSISPKASGLDLMSNAASNSYQSLAYPSYADQLNSALSSLAGSVPDAAASNQDPSYMPQLTMDNGQANSMYSNQNMNSNNNNVGPQQQQQQQQQQHQHQQGVHQAYNGDLSGYPSNINSQQTNPPQPAGLQQSHNMPSSISFNGPTNNGPNGVGESYMNSHLNPSSGHQQMNSYQASNLYNQFGDLSTSNFGNNAGGLSSVASYMSPNQPIDHVNSANSQHDMFSNTNNLPFGNQANQVNQYPAASQLAPSSVSPNANSQSSQSQSQSPSSPSSAASSLFSAASSLFGQSNPLQSNQQQQQASNSLFSGQHYLNSFLPQYNQFSSSQLGSGNDPMSSAGTLASASQQQAVAATPQTSGSSHRFGIKSFIIPMLAAAGLSLLIPTMSNIGTAVGRKKRSIEDKASAGNRQQQIAFDPFNGASQLAKEISIGEYMDKIERYYSIYKNAVENDDCLNRLICEFGDAVKDVTGRSAVITVIEKLAPAWMTGKVHLFKEATSDNKEGKEKCKKYVCHSNKHHQY